MSGTRLGDIAVVLSGIRMVTAAAVRHGQRDWNSYLERTTFHPAEAMLSAARRVPINRDVADISKRVLVVAENATVLSGAASYKVFQRAKKSLGLSRMRRSDSHFKLRPTNPIYSREGVAAFPRTKTMSSLGPATWVGPLDSLEMETIDDGDLEDDFDDEGEGSGTEYVYELNPKVSSMQLVNTVGDFTNEYEMFNAAFVAVPKSRSSGYVLKKSCIPANEEKDKPKPISHSMPVSQLSSTSKESKVPSSRAGRVATFAGLGVGLGLGAVAEASRRVIGMAATNNNNDSLLLTEANADRIVKTLCQVRGAALKIGQLISIQDETIVNPQLSALFERVRQAADFMPLHQMEETMVSQLGPDWRKKFLEFDDKPFAAASIGQVHGATLIDGRKVAVKIQYPGVARSIESDVNNILSLFKVFNILPEGFFLDNLMAHTKVELRQECDYEREAECTRRMKQILAPYSEYYVPEVVDELSTSQVLTNELIEGLTIDQCTDLDQETRNKVTSMFLQLLLRELFIHRYMQTDPNWANFLYNKDTDQLGLLDFGATREYRAFFVNCYFQIIDGAARGQTDRIMEYSRKVGFLTGYEAKAMNDAHLESVMILGEAFRVDRPFEFGKQKTTARMQELVPIMLKTRLCAPPPEVYSLHRKMSGLFLMASKLSATINCFHVWRQIASEFREHAE